MKQVRTRFAPSPTGFLHVGGVRTALFAWLVAKQNDGQFILRIEDTDRTRHVEESEKHIMDSLKWLSINWDGEVYRQSDRLDIYKEWANKLLEMGRAYADIRTPEELESIRTQAANDKKPVLFREHRPKNPTAWKEGMPLRFKSEPKAYKWQDAVMGELGTGPEVVDDFIIIKSDGFPTYNFAHIVDDHLMKISHVIRSQEFLPSVPKYLNLYEALGIVQPILATLPYVMAPNGNKKLSKRDGAKDILDYRREGYLPETMINFLASLGWNDGTEQEIFSTTELIEKFRLSQVQKSGARFDEQRLLWLNGAHIRALSIDDLYTKVEKFWPKEADDKEGKLDLRRIANSQGELARAKTVLSERKVSVDTLKEEKLFAVEISRPEDEGVLRKSSKYKMRVLKLVQERLKFFSELPSLTNFFFSDLPVNPELISSNKQLSKLSTDNLKQLLVTSEADLKLSDFSLKDLSDRLNRLLEATDQKPAVLFSLLRIATTQAPASPGLAETLAVLGKEVVLQRLKNQIESL